MNCYRSSREVVKSSRLAALCIAGASRIFNAVRGCCSAVLPSAAGHFFECTEGSTIREWNSVVTDCRWLEQFQSGV